MMAETTGITVTVGDLPDVQAALDAAAQRIAELEEEVQERRYTVAQVHAIASHGLLHYGPTVESDLEEVERRLRAEGRWPAPIVVRPTLEMTPVAVRPTDEQIEAAAAAIWNHWQPDEYPPWERTWDAHASEKMEHRLCAREALRAAFGAINA